MKKTIKINTLILPLIFFGTLTVVKGQEYFGLKYAETLLTVERLDPAWLRQLNQIRTGELMFNRLWRYNELLQLEGDLLEDVPDPTSHDGMKALSCRLKEGIQWPDGEPITIDDVEYSLDYYRKNGKGKRKKIAMDTELIRIDDRSFFLVGDEDRFLYHKRMNFPLIQIMPKHILQGSTSIANSHPYVKKPVGSGPFQLTQIPVISGSSVEIKYERNKHAIDNPPNPAERIATVIAVTETNTDNLIKQMQVSDDESVTDDNGHKGYDLFFQEVRDKANQNTLRREKHLTSQNYHSNTALAIVFNTENQFVSSVEFRQVIDMLMDDQKIIDQRYGSGMATDLTGPFNPNIGVLDNTLKDRTGTMSEIRTKLESQGFRLDDHLFWIDPATGGKTEVKLRLLYNNQYATPFSPEKKVLDKMEKEFREKAGISLSFDPVDLRSYTKKLKNKTGWDMALFKIDFGWSGNVAPILKSDSRYNFSRYSSTILDQYIDNYNNSDYRIRNEAIKQIHRHCYENLPYLFLWHILPEVFYRKILNNVSITPQYFFTTIGKWEIKGR